MYTVTSEWRRAAGAILLCVAATAHADSDEGVWTTATVGGALSADWKASVALQSRFIDGTGQLDRHLVRPSVTRLLGGGRSITLGYDAHFVDVPRDFVEHRLWQQYQQSWPVDKLRIDLRLRVEERVFDDLDGVTVRPRILAGFRYPLGSSAAFAIARNEVFFNVNSLRGGPQDGYDQNRLFLGVGGRLAARLTGEIGYQLQHIYPPSGDAFSIHQLFVALSVSLN